MESVCPCALVCTDMKTDHVHMQRRDAGNYDVHILNTSHLHLRELKDYTYKKKLFKLFLISMVIKI